MTLWHRAPREVYRVYGQDEYLGEGEVRAGEEPWLSIHGQPLSSPALEDRPSQVEDADRENRAAASADRGESPLRGVPVHSSRSSGSGRLIGLGLLAGVTAGALGLVVSSMSHRSPSPPSGTEPSTRGHTVSRRSAAHPSGYWTAARMREGQTASASLSRTQALANAHPDPHPRRHEYAPLPRLRRASGSSEYTSSVAGEPWPSQISVAGLNESSEAARSRDGEFDFER